MRTLLSLTLLPNDDDYVEINYLFSKVLDEKMFELMKCDEKGKKRLFPESIE